MAIKNKKQAEDIINSVINNTSIDKAKDIKEPEKFEVRVTRLAFNKRFAYGVLEGKQIEIFFSRNRDQSLGKRVFVVRADELGDNKFIAQ